MTERTLFSRFASFHDAYSHLFMMHIHIFLCRDAPTLSVRLTTSGDNEIRTRDLLLARQALSQLSYTPKWCY